MSDDPGPIGERRPMSSPAPGRGDRAGSDRAQRSAPSRPRLASPPGPIPAGGPGRAEGGRRDGPGPGGMGMGPTREGRFVADLRVRTPLIVPRAARLATPTGPARAPQTPPPRPGPTGPIGPGSRPGIPTGSLEPSPRPGGVERRRRAPFAEIRRVPFSASCYSGRWRTGPDWWSLSRTTSGRSRRPLSAAPGPFRGPGPATARIGGWSAHCSASGPPSVSRSSAARPP